MSSGLWSIVRVVVVFTARIIRLDVSLPLAVGTCVRHNVLTAPFWAGVWDRPNKERNIQEVVCTCAG